MRCASFCFSYNSMILIRLDIGDIRKPRDCTRWQRTVMQEIYERAYSLAGDVGWAMSVWSSCASMSMWSSCASMSVWSSCASMGCATECSWVTARVRWSVTCNRSCHTAACSSGGRWSVSSQSSGSLTCGCMSSWPGASGGLTSNPACSCISSCGVLAWDISWRGLVRKCVAWRCVCGMMTRATLWRVGLGRVSKLSSSSFANKGPSITWISSEDTRDSFVAATSSWWGASFSSSWRTRTSVRCMTSYSPRSLAFASPTICMTSSSMQGLTSTSALVISLTSLGTRTSNRRLTNSNTSSRGLASPSTSTTMRCLASTSSIWCQASTSPWCQTSPRCTMFLTREARTSNSSSTGVAALDSRNSVNGGVYRPRTGMSVGSGGDFFFSTWVSIGRCRRLLASNSSRVSIGGARCCCGGSWIYSRLRAWATCSRLPDSIAAMVGELYLRYEGLLWHLHKFDHAVEENKPRESWYTQWICREEIFSVSQHDAHSHNSLKHQSCEHIATQHLCIFWHEVRIWLNLELITSKRDMKHKYRSQQHKTCTLFISATWILPTKSDLASNNE